MARVAVDAGLPARRAPGARAAARRSPPRRLRRRFQARWHSYTESAMPIYEYRCEKGHTFEVLQRMSDDPISKCEVCGAPVHRVFHPVAVHFKGSGFYNTDYGKQKRAADAASSNNNSDDGKPAEKPKKPEKKSETPAASSSSD